MGGYEFEVNGNILEAKLYDTGVKEVVKKLTKERASMLLHSTEIFSNAQYMYSLPDYDGNPNIYRWNYFYTPVLIGGETVGVRIAIRDLVRGTNDTPESQIYNWKIKDNATLGGEGHGGGDAVASLGASSGASSDNSIPNSGEIVKRSVATVIADEVHAIVEAAEGLNEEDAARYFGGQMRNMAEAAKAAEAAGDLVGAEAYRALNAIISQAATEKGEQGMQAVFESFMEKGLSYGNISDGGIERDAGESAGGEAGQLDGGTGEAGAQADGGAEGRGAEGSRAVEGEVWRSARELGIARGSEERTLREVPETAWTDSMKAKAEEASGLGLRTICVNGVIKVNNPETGKTQAVGAVITDDGLMVVRADHPLYTAEQFADHELMHRRIYNDQALRQELKERLAERLTPEQISGITAQYYAGYNGIYGAVTEGMTADELEALDDLYFEEFLCDAYAGINRAFASGDAKAGRYTDTVRNVAAEREGMGYGAGGMPGTRYSIAEIEGEKENYGMGVVLDTNIFNGVSPRNWNKVLSKYVYDNMAGQEITVYDDAGNAETVYFARTTDRVKKDGASNSHRVIDKLARNRNGDNRRALAVVHLSEMLETSRYENSTDEHTHQWMDENGWEIRKTYVQDRAGNIYEATLNIAKGKERKILYDVNKIHKIDERAPGGDVPSTQKGRGSHTSQSSSEKNVPQKTDGVKGQKTGGDRYSIDEAEDENTRRALARAGADDIDIEGATRAQLRKTVSQGQKEKTIKQRAEKFGTQFLTSWFYPCIINR